jgi:hypothetical protein
VVKEVGSTLKIAVFLALFAIVLSSCTEPVSGYDLPGFLVEKPEVSAETAALGMPVTATVSVTFDLSEQSSKPRYAIEDLILGACIQRKEGESELSRGGLCEIDGLPLPSWIALSGGGEIMKLYSGAVIERGETLTLSHDFAFTLHEKGKVAVVPVVQFNDDDTVAPTLEPGEPVYVTFE